LPLANFSFGFSLKTNREKTDLPRLLIGTELIYFFGVSNGQDVFQVFVRASDDMSRNYFTAINALGTLYSCGH
jgi:hypothetical protein